MTAEKPDLAPQEGDYGALRQRVAAAVHNIHPDSQDEEQPGQELTGPELSAVVRIASEGVLRQLQEQGVKEAGTLAIRLGEAARIDSLADLSYTVAGRYTEAQAQRESGLDANAQAQQQRMALLASATGETAVAIVGSVLNPDGLKPLVASGREAIREYGTATYRNSGTELLTGLLSQAEAAQTSQETPVAA